MAGPGKHRTRLSADRIAALLFLAAVAVYGWQGAQFTAVLQVDVIGPSFFPKILTVTGLLLGALLLVSRTQQKATADEAPAHGDFAALAPAALLLAYILALEPAGFPIATVVFLAAAFKYLGHPSWAGAIVYSLVATAVTFLVFHVGLGLRLPLGLLGFLK